MINESLVEQERKSALARPEEGRYLKHIEGVGGRHIGWFMLEAVKKSPDVEELYLRGEGERLRRHMEQCHRLGMEMQLSFLARQTREIRGMVERAVGGGEGMGRREDGPGGGDGGDNGEGGDDGRGDGRGDGRDRVGPPDESAATNPHQGTGRYEATAAGSANSPASSAAAPPSRSSQQQHSIADHQSAPISQHPEHTPSPHPPPPPSNYCRITDLLLHTLTSHFTPSALSSYQHTKNTLLSNLQIYVWTLAHMNEPRHLGKCAQRELAYDRTIKLMVGVLKGLLDANPSVAMPKGETDGGGQGGRGVARRFRAFFILEAATERVELFRRVAGRPRELEGLVVEC